MSPRRIALPLVTLRRFPWLATALAPIEVGALEDPSFRPDAVAGWGAKTTAFYARLHAKARGLPFLTLEDGFYRSVGLGKQGTPALSFTLDARGPYFDARQESELEMLLLGPLGADIESRGRSLREFIVEKRLSKFNYVPEDPVRLDAPEGLPRILLVDQVAGDRSLLGAGASTATFAAMQAQAEALAREGRAAAFLKVHPDVVAGYAKGMFGAPSPLTRLAPEAGPHALLDEIDEVWTASSQLGFDALLRGRRVVTFAAPFYAGFGLTEDRPDDAAPHARAALARRAAKRLSLDALAGAAIGLYPRYFDPGSGRALDAEAALERLAFWRDHYHARRWPVVAVGFARHKHRLMRAYLGAAGPGVRFFRREPRDLVQRAQAAGAGEVVAWGDRISRKAESVVRAAGITVTRVEDGFLRSRGLGRKTTPPVSLCFDRRAAHFDATRPSDLEALLQTHAFTDAERARGAALVHRIVTGGLTKYNLRETLPDLRARARGRRMVLAMAQVPGDAAWRLGAVPFTNNLEFLSAVRAECPDAYLIYKEHPDVVARLRSGAIDREAADRLADCVLTQGDAAQLYPQIDTLHVMTSLSGFEALLRRREVVCWGLPFYAGWGLTQDRVRSSRRGRKLTLDELVVGTLALYPAYLSPQCGIPCEVEDVLTALAEPA
ncbi:capsular polysaccharide biosynthesis protein [Bosea sp. 117]|uniref:capsular polysaccharide biosynthesis protein n=1 Tax=Bosea sp. 117 TaxID=1125973 RepID=UPI00068B9656|nr:capsular polysaccharide biosynthesis protein [Bosea sp. 117]